jgi:isoleucyl-tRNA synthetase
MSKDEENKINPLITH